MDRSIYPEGVEVHQDDLARTESTKAFHILQRFLDIARMGKAFGGLVTVNSVNQRLYDVSGPARVYAPSGDLMAWDVPQLGLALDDYTLGVPNLVCAVYLETQTEPAAHESLGTKRNTAAVGTFSIQAFSQTHFNGLPSTSPDLTVPAQDRCTVLSVVPGPGAANLGVAGQPIGQQQAGFNQTTGNFISAAMPPTPNITGLSVVAISQNTQVGIGTLAITYVGPARNLTWTAPNDTTGVAVNVAAGGQFTLASGTPSLTIIVDVLSLPVIQPTPNTDAVTVSVQPGGDILSAATPPNPNITGINLKAISPTTSLGNGTLTITYAGAARNLTWTAPGESAGAAIDVQGGGLFTLSSSVAGHTLTVEVFKELLPTAQPSTNSDTIPVSELYSDIGPALSVIDALHRHKEGSYIPTPTNPHGTGMQDFAQQVINVVQTMRIGDNFLGSIALQLLPRIFMSVANNANKTLLWEIGGGSVGSPDSLRHIRFYRQSGRLEIVSNARWDGTQWVVDTQSLESQKYVFGGNQPSDPVVGLTGFRYLGGGATFTDAIGGGGWTETTIASGSAIAIGYLLDAAFPRIRVRRAPFITSNRTTLFHDWDTGSGVPLAMYLTNQGTQAGGLAALELCAGCVFDYNTNKWTTPNGGVSAKLSVTAQGIQVLYRPANLTPWDDTITSSTWRTVLDTDTTNLILRTGMTLEAGSEMVAGTSIVNPRFSAITSPSGAANGAASRFLIATSGTGVGASNVRWYHYGDNSQAGLCTELALGCHWDPNLTLWVPDSNAGSAFLFRFGIPPSGASSFAMFFRANNGSNWNDSAFGTLGWTKKTFAMTQSAGIEDGSLQFTPDAAGALANSNPAYNASILRNALYAMNIPKAWAAFAIDPSNQTIPYLDGFNIASITLNNFNRCVTVAFTRPMHDAEYLVVWNALDQYDATLWGTGSLNSDRIAFPFATNKATTGFQFCAGRLNTDAHETRLIDLSHDTVPTIDALRHVSFQVFGRMDP